MKKKKKKKRPTRAQSKKAQDDAKRRQLEHTKFLAANDMLHFARTHDACGRTGASQCHQYNKKLGLPPETMNLPYEAAVHHILPVSAVIAFKKLYQDQDPGLQNIASVYAEMEWCINTKDNLMWLPYFPVYQRHLAAGKPASAPSSFAAHNFDHNPHYNDIVSIS